MPSHIVSSQPTNNDGSANTSGTRNVQDSVSPLSNNKTTGSNNTSTDASISGSHHHQQQQSSSSSPVVPKIKIDDSSVKKKSTSGAVAGGNGSGDKSNDELGPRRVLHFPSPESHKHYQYQHQNNMQHQYPQQSPPLQQQHQQYRNKHHHDSSSSNNNNNSSGFNSRLDEHNMNMMNQHQAQYQQRQGPQQHQMPLQSSSSPHSSYPPPSRGPYGQQHHPYNMRYNNNNHNSSNKGSNYPIYDDEYPKQSQHHHHQQQQNQQHFYNHPGHNHQNQFGPTPVKPNRHYAAQGMQASRMAYEQQQQQQQHQDPNQGSGGIGLNGPNQMSSPSQNVTKIDSGNSTRSSLASPLPKSVHSNHEDMVNHSGSAVTHTNRSSSINPPDYNSGIGDNAGNSSGSDKNNNPNANTNHTHSHQELSPSMNRGDSGNSNNNNRSGNSNSNNNNSNSNMDNSKPRTDNLPQASPLERFKYDHHNFHSDRNSSNMPMTMNSGYHSATRDHSSSAGMGIGGMTIMTPCSINMTPASSTDLAGFGSAGFEDAANSFMVSPAVAISKRGNSKR